MISFNTVIRCSREKCRARRDTNWFTCTIHLCTRKYCAKANWKILKPPNFARAVPRGVTNFLKWEFHSVFISFTRTNARVPLQRPTRDSIFRVVFRCVAREVGDTLSPHNFFLISCLVSFVLRRNHAFVLRNHSIYLRAKKAGSRTTLYIHTSGIKI